MVSLNNSICICNNCLLNSTNSIFVARGKKTEFILQNNSSKKVDKLIVDDCLLNTKHRDEKCDYLFRIVEDAIVFLVECKGSDILKAVSQIDSTLTILKSELNNFLVKGRIVSTKVHSPDIRRKEYKNLRARLNSHLETKNVKLVEII